MVAGLVALGMPGVAVAGGPPGGGGPAGLGLGGGLGMSGISGKLYLGDGTALQGVVGNYGYWDGDVHVNGGLGVGVDLLLEQPTFAGGELLDVGWCYGVGGAVGVGGGVTIGASGVVGLELLFNPLPIDFVIEWRPGVTIGNGLDLSLFGSSGHVRYYF